MEEIMISDKIWDLAADFCKRYFQEESENIKKRFWVENRAPNFQGLLGELGFIEWLGVSAPEEYLENRPVFRRSKGIDLVVGNYKVDIKTPTLPVPPKKYHRLLIEKPLVDKNICDFFVCQFLIRPEMKSLFLMGYASPEDVRAFGEPREKGQLLYGTVISGYAGYLIECEHLKEPSELKKTFQGLILGDTLLSGKGKS